MHFQREGSPSEKGKDLEVGGGRERDGEMYLFVVFK